MAAAQPVSIINESIQQIAQQINDGECNEFDLRRIARTLEQALGNRAITPGSYHMALALIGLAKGERQATISACENAVSLAPRDTVVMSNCLLALTSFGEIDKTAHLIDKFVRAFPDDKQSLLTALDQWYYCVQLNKAADLVVQLEKLHTHISVRGGISRLGGIMLSIDAAKKLNYSDEALGDRLKTAIEAIRTLDHEVQRISMLTLHDGSFLHRLHVRANRDKCAELNFKIADALVEHFDDTYSDLVSFVCCPLSDFKDQLQINEVA